MPPATGSTPRPRPRPLLAGTPRGTERRRPRFRACMNPDAAATFRRRRRRTHGTAAHGVDGNQERAAPRRRGCPGCALDLTGAKARFDGTYDGEPTEEVQ